MIIAGVVELLRVDKDDFDVLLYCNYKQEHCMRLDGLRAVPFMASWSQKDLEYCNNVSILKEYPPNYVRLSNIFNLWKHKRNSNVTTCLHLFNPTI